MTTKSNTAGIVQQLGQKIRDYKELVKFRLALSVVFSACTAYVLGVDVFLWSDFLILALGGFFITGSANALNQVLEKETDKLMVRTRLRPLPAGRMEMSEAVLFAGLFGAIGILLLAYFNPATAALGAFSLVCYAFIYTPMKRVSPAAVWIGAIPGALPMTIGWVAATPTGEIGIEAVFLFSLQFLWQFPHFWAIAWIAYEDYAKAGFYLLPTSQKDGRTKSTVLQIIFYIICLIAISYAPFYLSISGLVACTLMLLSGFVFLYFAIVLYLRCTRLAARNLMFASLFYQLVVFIALMADKI